MSEKSRNEPGLQLVQTGLRHVWRDVSNLESCQTEHTANVINYGKKDKENNTRNNY